MDKKPYHHGNLEEALIETGLALVDREGLDAMTLRKVAAACGVSHTAPYKHFGSKEELLAAMGRYVEERFAETLEKAYTRENSPDAMVEMAQAYLRFFCDNPHYFGFFQKGQQGMRVNLSELEEVSAYRPFEVFKQAAVRGLAHLKLNEEELRQTVVGMWAMVHGCTAISVMDGVEYDGDWTQLLGNILQNNMTVRGGHFDG